MKRKNKLNLILVIFVIVLVLGLGYAYLTTNLSINGTTDVDANTWNVFWNNVQVTSGSVTGSQVTQTPTIDTNKTTVSFRVNLKQPGEFYEFTVDAKNTGSIDAMVETITKTTNIPNYLKYEVTYVDGIAITESHLLAANSTETYKVRVEYRTDINPSDLPATSQSISLSFGLTYLQADTSATPVRTAIFTVSNTPVALGYEVPSDLTTYNSYQEALSTFEYPFFLKHVVSNNVIALSYVGFVLNNNVYYLRGGVDEHNLSSQPIYESNKEVLTNVFGSSNCTETTYDTKKSFYCSDWEAYDISITIDSEGDTIVRNGGPGGGGYQCEAYTNSVCNRGDAY